MKVSINHILRIERRAFTRGAPMVARNFHDSTSPLHVQRVDFIDGDYGPDGTYWGGGRGTLPLYCAFNGEDEEFAVACGSRVYVRASDREGALRAVKALYPDVTFKR
jgi:hypothetical protein